MAITLEAIRAAGGIVHSDGNIFFRDISMLQGLAGAAPAAVAPRGEYPHEQMDAMALDRYKVVPSNASMLWSHAVVAGDGTQQLYVGREVECQNMVRKFAGAFLDGAFAFHSTAAAPTAQAAPALEAPAAPEVTAALDRMDALLDPKNKLLAVGDKSATAEASRADMALIRAALAAAPQAPRLGEDALHLLRRLLSNQHTLTGPEFRAELEKIVAEESARHAAAPQAPAAPSPGMTPRDKATQDQIASVMLQHGTPEQQSQALAYASGEAPAAPAVDAADSARLDFVLQKDAFIVWTDRDDTIRQCQLMTQDEDEHYHVISGEHRFFNTPRQAIDAAIAAQAAAKGEHGNG